MNFKIFLLFCGTVQVIAGADSLVTLNLQSTGCDDWCIISTAYQPSNTQCLSSIKLNGQQLLEQEAGLNIAVINIESGAYTVKYIEKLGGLFLGSQRRKNFSNFINSINYDALVVIVTLDMCYLRYDDWYNILVKETVLKLNSNVWLPDQNLAMAVGCIGKCPTEVLQGSIPYLYTGTETSYSTTIQFKLKGGPIPTTLPIETILTTTSKSNMNTIIIILVVLILFTVMVIIFIVVITRTKHGKKYKRIWRGIRNRGSNMGNDVNANNEPSASYTPTPSMFQNNSYAKQNSVIMIKPKTQYENTKTDDRFADGGNEYACLSDQSNSYEKLKMEPTNYTYIDPKLDSARSEENLYYTATKDMLQRARSVTELTDISITSETPEEPPKERSNTQLSYLSVSPGTSHQIFKNPKENNISPTEKNFATYVKVNDGSALYKSPSNVSKHPPPQFPLPKPKQDDAQESYVDMEVEGREYDTCGSPLLYETLNNGNTPTDTYQALET